MVGCQTEREELTRAEISEQLRALGVHRGGILGSAHEMEKGDIPLAQPTTRYCGVAGQGDPLREAEKTRA